MSATPSSHNAVKFVPPQWASPSKIPLYLSCPRTGKVFAISNQSHVVLGRDPLSAHLVVDHPTVSRVHCAVVNRSGYKSSVIDLSTFGTKVNGEAIPKDVFVPLDNNAKLVFGDSEEFIFLAGDISIHSNNQGSKVQVMNSWKPRDMALASVDDDEETKALIQRQLSTEKVVWRPRDDGVKLAASRSPLKNSPDCTEDEIQVIRKKEEQLWYQYYAANSGSTGENSSNNNNGDVEGVEVDDFDAFDEFTDEKGPQGQMSSFLPPLKTRNGCASIVFKSVSVISAFSKASQLVSALGPIAAAKKNAVLTNVGMELKQREMREEEVQGCSSCGGKGISTECHRLGCGHVICGTCTHMTVGRIEEFIQMGLEKTEVREIKCPVKSCGHLIDEMEFRSIVGNDAYNHALELIDQKSSIDCPICLFSVPKRQSMNIHCKDEHCFCKDCLQQSVEISVKEKTAVTCPLTPDYPLSPVEIQDICGVGSPLIEKYQQQCLERELDARTDMVACPAAGCNNHVIIKDPSKQEKCTCSCGFVFCSKCKGLYHYTYPCKEISTISAQWVSWLESSHDPSDAATTEEAQKRIDEFKKQVEEQKAGEMWKAENCKCCPKCGRAIEKTGGCSLMVCGRDYHGGNVQDGCGASFSWTDATPYLPNVPDADKVAAQIRMALSQNLAGNAKSHGTWMRCNRCEGEIKGIRLNCVNCEDNKFNLCQKCYPRSGHDSKHIFALVFAPKGGTKKMMKKNNEKGGNDGIVEEEEAEGEAVASINIKRTASALAAAALKGETFSDFFPGISDASTDTQTLYKAAASKYRNVFDAINHNDIMALRGFFLSNWSWEVFDSESGLHPLHFAVAAGHESLVEILLDCGAMINRPASRADTGDTPMHTAVRKKRGKSMLQLLVDRGCEIDCLDVDGRTPLQVACSTSNPSLETVQWFLSHNATVVHVSSADISILASAVASRNLQVVQLILDNGGWETIAVADSEKNIPLHIAAGNGDLEIVRLLLQRESETQLLFGNKHRMCSIHMAALFGHTDVIDDLLTRDPSTLSFKNDLGLNPLFLAASCTNQAGLSAVKLLISRGARCEPNFEGFTAMHIASEQGDLLIVQELTAAFPDQVNVVVKNSTPVIMAAMNKHEDVVMFLLQNGADLRCNKRDDTLLHVIAKAGCFNVILFLGRQMNIRLDGSAKTPLSGPDGNGFYAMHVAASHGHLQAVRALSSLGAHPLQPSSRESGGILPIHCAASGGHVEVIDWFLKHGSVVGALCDMKTQPLHFAAMEGHVAAARFLVESCGANVNARDISDSSPLHYAASHGQVDMVKYLLGHDAYVNSKNDDDDEPLDLAASEEVQAEIRKYLLQHDFKKFTFFKPKHCCSCEGMLWGVIKQGYKCGHCHLAIHKKCFRAGLGGHCGSQWKAGFDPTTHKEYYVNNITKESVWKHPTMPGSKHQ